MSDQCLQNNTFLTHDPHRLSVIMYKQVTSQLDRSFVSRNYRPCNLLPDDAFPSSSNLQLFKFRINNPP